MVLKPDIGMGGDSIFILETKKILKSKIHLSFPAVIQELISVEKEGSIQFIRFSNKWVIFLCETYQSYFKYCGFRFPFTTSYGGDFFSTSNVLLDYFCDKYDNNISSFGIDFIISDGNIYYHDINPRHTAATYIFSLIIRLYGYEVLSRTELEYLQVKHDCKYEYDQLIDSMEQGGMPHMSNNVAEGFCLIYPSMLNYGLINIVFISQTHRIDTYREMFFDVIKRHNEFSI